jgi:predicted ferric reductase
MALKTNATQDVTESMPELVSAQNVIIVILVIVAAVLFVLNLVPLWMPGLMYSLDASQPKIFWFISRGSAIAAYWILWLSMALGVVITNKMAKVWPGISPAYEVHQYTSLLGLGLGLFHALILMGDQYIHYNLLQVLVPFASLDYRPLWVGLGQIGFYIWGAVVLSFYVRKRIGQKTWRWIHYFSYASFLSVMVHGIYSGTDVSTVWAQGLYWFSGASLLFLTVYRILVSRFPEGKEKAHQAVGKAG